MKFETISANDIDKYVDDKKAMIVDVREPEDYNNVHIRNAVNIPFNELQENNNDLPSDRPLVLYCDRGGLSMLAAKDLYDKGYTVRPVIGGINAYRGRNIIYGN